MLHRRAIRAKTICGSSQDITMVSAHFSGENFSGHSWESFVDGFLFGWSRSYIRRHALVHESREYSLDCRRAVNFAGIVTSLAWTKYTSCFTLSCDCSVRLVQYESQMKIAQKILNAVIDDLCSRNFRRGLFLSLFVTVEITCLERMLILGGNSLSKHRLALSA